MNIKINNKNSSFKLLFFFKLKWSAYGISKSLEVITLITNLKNLNVTYFQE